MTTTRQAPDSLDYRSLADLRKTLRVKWYRCPISAERLRVLSARTDRQGWVQAGGHVALDLALACLTVWLWSVHEWLAFGMAVWSLGFVATFFKGTAAHELGHGTVFRTRWLLILPTSARICWEPHSIAV